MAEKKETALAPATTLRDPFSLLRQMTAELDRAFDEPFFRGLRWAPVRPMEFAAAEAWAPKVDVFEKDGRLITRVDLPGVKKEDVTVEVTDGHLALSGERKQETEEKKDNVYRSERQYGTFYRAVPLPEGVKLEDVKATFTGGVLEVSVPLPTKAQPTMRKVEIQEPAPTAPAAKASAA
jgi:HSP20 family protein